jgi:hypothetical protein
MEPFISRAVQVVYLSIFRKHVPLANGSRLSCRLASPLISPTTLQRPVDLFPSVLTYACLYSYIALLHDPDKDNVEWAWTLALFVFLVLAQCRTITLRIGWSCSFFII